MTSAESKAVGHDGDLIQTYPTFAEIEDSDRVRMCQWYRYLRSPRTNDEADILNTIIVRLKRTCPAQ
jgi:hypothetical protein